MSEFKQIYRMVGDVLVKTYVPRWHMLGPGDIAAGPDGLPDFGMSAPEPEAAPPQPSDVPKGEGKPKGARNSGEGGEAAPSEKSSFMVEMERSKIRVAGWRSPKLAARLAADHSIPVEEAIARLAHSPSEMSLPDYSDTGAHEALSGTFGSSLEAGPATAAQSLDQFKRVAQAAVDERDAFTIRV